MQYLTPSGKTTAETADSAASKSQTHEEVKAWSALLEECTDLNKRPGHIQAFCTQQRLAP